MINNCAPSHFTLIIFLIVINYFFIAFVIALITPSLDFYYAPIRNFNRPLSFNINFIIIYTTAYV